MGWLTVTGVCGVLGLCGCGGRNDNGAPSGSARPVVLTTFEPTRSMAERIGGDLFEVGSVLAEGADPVHWTPGPGVIAELQRADLIVLNGAGLEKWAATAPLPESRIVETAQGIGLIETGEASHSHGPAGAHTHGEFDPHTWVDPENAAEQAGVIRDAMIALRPDDRDRITQGYDELAAELATLSGRLRALTPRLEGVQMVCSHPAYNYLARKYGWEVTNFDLDPETALVESRIADLRVWLWVSDHNRSVRRRLMLWESEPIAETRSLLRELGIVSVAYEPAEGAGEGSFVERQRANVERLEAALR